MSISLDKDEYVIYEARRSWFVLWNKTVGLFFSILIPIVLFSLISAIEFNFVLINKDTLFIVCLLSWIFIVWNLLFVAWTDHYLDVLVITNKHLIDIEQKGVFSREISVLQLDKIQDVTTEINGFINTVIGYGDLHIQSAGNDKEFTLKNIANPNLVRSKIKQAISGEVSEGQIE
jgi:uncharacterized membrane protein YdbT with pleckstrin-like domain